MRQKALAAILALASSAWAAPSAVSLEETSVSVSCPVGQVTRVVFPEAVRELRLPPPATARALGLRVVQPAPETVMTVNPSKHPVEGVVEFEGAKLRVKVTLSTAPSGPGGEFRVKGPSAQSAWAAGGSSGPSPREPGASPVRAQEKAGAMFSATVMPPHLKLSQAGTSVRVDNRSQNHLRLLLVARSGRRFVADDVEPGTAFVPLEEFSPPLPRGVEIVRVEGEPWAAEPTEALLQAGTSAPPSLAPTVADEASTEVSGAVPPSASSPSEGATKPPLLDEPSEASGLSGPAKSGPLALLAPEILTARPRRVGRVERLPGQRATELMDILEGETFLWLRFAVAGGGKGRVEHVSWEHGPIASYTAEPTNKGRDLLVVVQLPRRDAKGKALVTRATRITLKLDDGERKFSLSAPWLSAFVKDILGL